VRGYVRQRGKIWSCVIDLGSQKAQRWGCRKGFWIERTSPEAYPKRPRELRERVEGWQRERRKPEAPERP